MNVAVVIPTFNEKETLPSLIEKIFEKVRDVVDELHIIIVDDSSPDGTAQIAEKLGEKFEKISSKILGINENKVCSVNTGFSAIHLACIALKIKEGDEVIVPSLTNVADAQVIVSLGAKIVFCEFAFD